MSPTKRRVQSTMDASQHDLSLVPDFTPLLPPFELKEPPKRKRHHRPALSVDLNSPPVTPPSTSEWPLLRFYREKMAASAAATLVQTKRRTHADVGLGVFKLVLKMYVGFAVVYCTLRILFWVHGVPYGDKLWPSVPFDEGTEPLEIDLCPGLTVI